MAGFSKVSAINRFYLINSTMKKFLLSGLCLIAMPLAFADGVEPFILPDAIVNKMSKDGSLLMGQAGDGNAITYNIVTGEAYYYNNCTIGNGFPASDNGIIVGANMINSGIAVTLKGGRDYRVTSLADYPMSDLHSITPDATRTCGVVEDPSGRYNYLPIYCDIDAEGNIGEPHFLPFPEKDFLGTSPQYCSAVWLSEDGKMILGQVIDRSGFYKYPLVYREGSDGTWTYSFPSESLFNPDKLPVPEWPGELEQVFPDAKVPEYIDYMSPEKYKEFEEDVEAWQNSGMEDDSPYDNLWLYMTPEEIEAFNDAVDLYWDYAMQYEDVLAEYYDELDVILNKSVFFEQNAMAMNRAGTMFVGTAKYFTGTGDYNYIQVYEPILFNLEEGTHKYINYRSGSLLPNEILADGTVILNSLGGDIIPQVGYILLPGAESFITVEEFIRPLSAYYADWIKDNLTDDIIIGTNAEGGYITQEMTVSGIICTTDDKSVFSGAVDGYYLEKDMYFTYIISDVYAGVETVSDVEEPSVKILADGVIECNGEIATLAVYDLAGKKVFEVERPLNTVNTGLENGIYIVVATANNGIAKSEKVKF